MALLLTAVMVVTTVVPMNVSAAPEESNVYQSQAYSVNGITAYAYDGADLSQEGLTFQSMTDNKALMKALYYSYGSLGYSKEFAKIDPVYVSYGAAVDTDRLAISEMILTQLMNEDEDAYDTKTTDFMEAIKELPDYDTSVFVPYYILSSAKEIVGYTSTSSEAYETPSKSEESSEEDSEEELASSENNSEDASESTSEELTSEEASTEESTEKSSEEKETDNLANADGTYKDGIRNRNNGTLARVLGGNVTTVAILGEIEKHWSDDTYFGRSEYKNYDFVSTLLSNISGKEIDGNILEFAEKNKLEVKQVSGTVEEITNELMNEKYAYYRMGDIFVVDYKGKEYCGIYTELFFYQKNLDNPNTFCMYNVIPGYENITGEFNAMGNDNAWIWFDGEKTVLSPLEFDGDITLSIIKANREGVSISSEGQVSQVLSDGSVILNSALSRSDESAGKITANALTESNQDAFTKAKSKIESFSEPLRHGSYLNPYDKTVTAGDGKHANFYYRMTNAESENSDEHKAGDEHTTWAPDTDIPDKATFPTFTKDSPKTKEYGYCGTFTSHKCSGSHKLITCGEAKLISVKSTSQWEGGTIEIQNYGKGSVKGAYIATADTDNSPSRVNEKVLVNPSALVGAKLEMDYCRDKGQPAPGGSTDGYYELYLQNVYIKGSNVYYTVNVLWYSDERLTNGKAYQQQRLCNTFSFGEPLVTPVQPEKKDATVSVGKIPYSGSHLINGDYIFALCNSAGTELERQTITVSGGKATSIANFTIDNCFTYTKADSLTNGAPQYNAKTSDTFYVKEVDSQTGMTGDDSKAVKITIANAQEYKDYIKNINTINSQRYSNKAEDAARVCPSPKVIYSAFGNDYPNSEFKPGVSLRKTSDASCKNLVTYNGSKNENYSLEGAEYTIYTDLACTQVAKYYQNITITTSTEYQDFWHYESPANAVITMDANGNPMRWTTVSGNDSIANDFASNKSICMDPGTYYVLETKAPKGYARDTERHTITVQPAARNQVFTLSDSIVLDPLSVTFQKRLTGNNTKLGEVSAAGVPFLVEYFTDAGLTKKWWQASFRTDNNGELFFNKAYLSNDVANTFPSECWTADRVAQLEFPAGFVKISEINNDSNSKVGTLLKGTVTLPNNQSFDLTNGIVFSSTVTGDDGRNIAWKCVSGNNAAVNDGDTISINDERVKRFDIAFTKTDQSGTPMAGIPFIIRNKITGESHMVVSDEKGFVTTRRTDNVVVNGETVTLDSLKSSKDPYYNSNDSYDAKDKTLINNELIPSPVWFYGTAEDVTKSDSYASYKKERDEETYHGSLVYSSEGGYEIYELQTKASEGKQLLKSGELSFGGTMDGSMVFLTDGKLDATIINYDKQKIKTVSRDKDTASKYSNQAENITIIDDFEVTNLKYNKPYTVKGVLVARADTTIHGVTYHAGEPIKDSNDNYILAHSSFTTGKTASDGKVIEDKYSESRKDSSFTSTSENTDGTVNGQTSLIYTLNTLDFESCQAVFYTYLCNGIDDKDLVITDGQVDKDASNVIKERVISEVNEYYDYVEDEDLTNRDEFVDVVCISTDTWSETYQTNVEAVSKETVVNDTVVVNGLLEGTTYTLLSKLADAETGEILTDSEENPLIGLINGETDQFTFTPDGEGKQTLTVKYPAFDSTPYADKSVVCYQYLLDENGIMLGHGDNITNERETMHFPAIQTTATAEDGDKSVQQFGEVTINDEVVYTSLAPDKEYILTGTLHYLDKEGNEQTLHYKDGSEVTSTVTFTPEEPNGKVLVPFTFKVTDIEENIYDWERTVVFEDLRYNDISLVTHADIKDEEQTVLFPGIHTSLREKETGVQNINTFDKDITLVDTVAYTNLRKGKSYRIIGKLINKETGEVVKIGDKDVTSTTVFTPNKDGELIEWKPKEESTEDATEETSTEVTTENSETTMETTTEKPAEVKEEKETSEEISEDANNSSEEKETEDVPAEPTLADMFISGSVEVVFTFNGKDTGLIAEDGHNAPIVAYEYVYDEFDINNPSGDIEEDKEDTKESTEDSSEVTTEEGSSEEVTEATEEASTEISEEASTEVNIEEVSTETGSSEESSEETNTEKDFADVYEGVKLWTKHTEFTEIEQTVTAPTGHTTLTDNITKGHEVSSDSVVTLTDKVVYKGLLPGKTYTMTGALYIPKEQANDAELLLLEKDDKGNECVPLLDETGKKIQGSATFVAETPDGEVDITFSFNRSLITHTKSHVVAFEEVSDEEEGVVWTHKDITDNEQTVYVPEVHTTALSEDTKEHIAGAYPTAKIIDTVELTNLAANRTHKLVGTLMNQATGQPLTIDGAPIVSESEPFVSATEQPFYNGTVDVVFEFDASLLKGITTVVYEKLFVKKLDEEGKETDEWVEVGNHEDISDGGQTVHLTDLKTTALGKDSENHQIMNDTKAVIIDAVEYTNLIPGKEYTVSGILMVLPEDTKASDLDIVDIEEGKTLADYVFTFDRDKNIYIDENGYKCKALKVDGEFIESKTTFTPTEPNGSVDVTFQFDASALKDRTIVVFEDLYMGELRIGTHADITDKGQTITVKGKNPGNPPSIETGDSFPLISVIVFAVIFLLGILGLLITRRKFFK